MLSISKETYFIKQANSGENIGKGGDLFPFYDGIASLIFYEDFGSPLWLDSYFNY